MFPWQWYIRQLNDQKVEVCVVNLLPFMATKGSRILEKKVNETGIKTVFSHLKTFARLHHQSLHSYWCMDVLAVSCMLMRMRI